MAGHFQDSSHCILLYYCMLMASYATAFISLCCGNWQKIEFCFKFHGGPLQLSDIHSLNCIKLVRGCHSIATAAAKAG